MQINNFSEKFYDIKIASGINFKDNRGSLKKTMYGDKLNELTNIKEVIMSTSYKNVIRGLHYQKKPHEIRKFVTCVYGEILDVFVNIDKNSANYKSFDSLILNADDDKAILIPEGYAHGYSVLSEFAIVVYLQSEDYEPQSELCFNPLSLNIDWKVTDPIISPKDLSAPNI